MRTPGWFLISSAVPDATMRPPTSTEMRSASENTASMSCSIKRIVYCRFKLASSFDIARDSSMPKPAIGSSSSSMIGWVASAMPSSSCRCCPCDIFDAMRLPRGERPTSAMSLRAGRRRRAIRSAGCQNRKLWRSVACTASAMLPSAVKLSKMLVIWNDRASPSRARRAVDSSLMSRPSKVIRPASGLSSPVSCPTSVVLPAPFGPMSAWVSPLRMPSVTSSVATSAPNALRKCSISSRNSLTFRSLGGSRLGIGGGLERLGEIDLGRADLVGAGRAYEHAPDAVLDQQHARHQQWTEEQHPMLGEIGEDVAKGEKERRAHNRADQRIGRSENDHREQFARQLPAHRRRAHELCVIGYERAGEPRDAAGDDEDGKLVWIGWKADGGRAPLVVANAADHHAELRPDDPVREQHDQHQQREHDVIEGRVIAERNESQTVALGQGEAVVAAPIAQALGEVIDHLGKGERHHDELEAARAQRQCADRQCEQHRDHNGERPGH